MKRKRSLNRWLPTVQEFLLSSAIALVLTVVLGLGTFYSFRHALKTGLENADYSHMFPFDGDNGY